MFTIEPANKPFQRELEFSSTRQPGMVHTVSGAIDVTSPDPLEPHENITSNMREVLEFVHLIGECDCRCGFQMRDPAKRPLRLRPIPTGEQLHAMTGIDYSRREPLQISLRAATGRISAAHKANREFSRRHLNEF